jgi:prepilin-type N-terminal cleavage/methylation domain-containing protein
VKYRVTSVTGRPGAGRSGISLVEMMITLVIMATLMTAVAAAYSASTKAIQINDQFFRASQSGRVCLNQLLSEIRQCATVEVTQKTLSIVPTTGTTAKVYTYSPDKKQLLLAVTDVNGTTYHALASNISAMSFTGGSGNVGINITVTVGGNAVALSGSVTPRRAVVYK